LERLVWEKLQSEEARRALSPSREAGHEPDTLGPTLELLEDKKNLIQKVFVLVGAVLFLAIVAALFELARVGGGSLLPVALIAVVAVSAAIALGYCLTCDSGCSTVRALLVTRRWQDAIQQKNKTLCLTGLPDVLFARSGGDHAEQ
jgi:hypothetical protein